MTPRRDGRAAAVSRYLPTLAGGCQAARVRSGESTVQVSPPLVVFQSTFDAKYNVRGSIGEKSTGIVRTRRYSLDRSRRGATFWTWPVRRSYRVSRPP